MRRSRTRVIGVLPRAETEASDLTQEANKRGLWDVDRGSNLIRLPSTPEAYEKSPIKIKHRGSHPVWSQHVGETLEDAQDELEEKYGSLDKVPDSVLKQALENMEVKLRKDLLNINKGKKQEWIKPQPDGTDKLSMMTEQEETIA